MTQLAEPYRNSSFDATVPRDLLADEVAQRRETGYLVDDVVARANVTDPEDRVAVLALVDGMADSVRGPWAYEEPDALDDIRSSAGPVPAVAVDRTRYADRVRAAWLGRIAGCNVGKPVELGSYWTVERIRDYLELAGAYPLTDYVPALDPMPAGFELREDNWRETTRGRVNGSARDDDIDYTILGLHLLETHGRALRTEHVGRAWLELFPVFQVYTAERAAYLNLVNGVRDPVGQLRDDVPTMIQTQSKAPLATTFFAFQQGFTQNYPLISAAGLITLVPMLVLFLALQRRFVDGLASSGLGGR